MATTMTQTRKSIQFRLALIVELHDIGGWNWEEIAENLGTTPLSIEDTYRYTQNREKKIEASKKYYVNNTAAHRRNRKKNYDKHLRWKLKNKMFINDIVVEYHDHGSFNFREIAEILDITPNEAHHKYINGKNRNRYNGRYLAVFRTPAA